MTLAAGKWRHTILRVYWDDQDQPSVECPVGDFFACGWETFAQVTSLAVCVNPGRAFNCYWEMPFRKRARITMENLGDEAIYVYYQINYTLTDVPDDAAYFHAQFRRVNPLPYKEVYTILDGVKGQGHYVGHLHGLGRATTPAGGARARSSSTWTATRSSRPSAAPGTEDYFCGSYDFDSGPSRATGIAPAYVEFTTPYAGLPQVIRPDGALPVAAALRHVPLAHHRPGPVRRRLARHDPGARLAHRPDRRYLPLQDDIASVAFWYQTLPTAPFPALPDRDYLEVI